MTNKTSLANIPNIHTFLGSSNEGAVVGCQGKGMRTDGECGIVQYKGGKRKTRKRKKRRVKKRGGATMNLTGRHGSPKTRQSGGGYAYTTASAAQSFGPHDLGQGFNRHGTLPVAGYKNCGIIPNFKLGASANYVGTKHIQKGAGAAGYPGPNSLPMTVDAYNQYNNSSYGYTNGSQNDVLRGSYAPITNLSHKQQCKLSGGKRKKRKTRKHKKRKTRKQRKHKKRRSKKQRGGYAQYKSNVPLTWTQQIPAGPSGGTWQGQLANPPTYIKTDNCNNNYNHYTGKNAPSPVLDQAVPSKTY